MTNKIRISLDGAILTGSLNDSKAARDFAAMLPLTLTLQDYNGTEKISDLPRRLSREGAPDGLEPSAGDVVFYPPGAIWRCSIAVFGIRPAWCCSAASTAAWRCAAGLDP